MSFKIKKPLNAYQNKWVRSVQVGHFFLFDDEVYWNTMTGPSESATVALTGINAFKAIGLAVSNETRCIVFSSEDLQLELENSKKVETVMEGMIGVVHSRKGQNNTEELTRVVLAVKAEDGEIAFVDLEDGKYVADREKTGLWSDKWSLFDEKDHLICSNNGKNL